MQLTYAKMPELIRLQADFATPSGSVTAVKTAKSYTVWSYETQIFKVVFKDSTIYYNDTRYSNTTAKLQAILKEFISNNNMSVKLVTGKARKYKFEV